MLTYTNHLEQVIGERLGDDTVRGARERDDLGEVYVLVPACDPRSVAVGPCRYSVALAHAVLWDGQTTDTSYFVRLATAADLRNA